MEISLQTSSGMGPKPMPIRLILAYIVSGLACFWCVTSTFIGDGGIWIIPFVILWGALTFLLFKRDDTDLPQYKLVGTMMSYLPKSARKLTCRPSDNVKDIMNFIGVYAYDPETGLIEFNDNTFGYAYMVTGSASILLFDEDRKAILDRVDAFYRTMKEDVELIYVTDKEAQKVHRQLEAEVKRYRVLDTDDPDLQALSDVRFRCLRDHVGGVFRSIHQYLILKADNKEALDVAENVLRGEVENSSHMFKRCVALVGDDVENVFKSIYQGKESV